MKKHILGLCLTASIGIFSDCEHVDYQAITSSQTMPVETPTGEARAIETLDRFIDELDRDSQTRTTGSVNRDAKVVSVKKTSAAAYGGRARTRSEDGDLPLYELTLENPDNTTGFAVVIDPDVIDQVIAYAPVGSIADTVHNKGLAVYFRELAMLSDAASRRAETRAWINEPYQPEWQDNMFAGLFSEVVAEPEFFGWWGEPKVRALRPLNAGPTFYGPLETGRIIEAAIPMEWGQTNPYNNKTPMYIGSESPYKEHRNIDNIAVGCTVVALAYIMAYHKQPVRYNWDLFRGIPHVPITDTLRNGSVDLTKETPLQDEVSHTLYSIGLVLGTTYSELYYVSTTPNEYVVPTLNRFGYDAAEISFDSGDEVVELMREELSYHMSTGQGDPPRNGRPVMISAAEYGENAGHIWVVDAMITHERWLYNRFISSEAPDAGREGVMRTRVRGSLVHCNWGWNGDANGWFYSFQPLHGGALRDYDIWKKMFYGITPSR